MSGGKQGVEYEIGAKDTTGAAVSSAINGVEKLRSAATGAAGGTEALARQVKGVVPALLLMNSAMGESNGVLRKVTRSISSVASAFLAFGPGGAIVAAFKAGFDAMATHLIEKSEKMLEKAREFGAKMSERLARMKDARIDSLERGLERTAIQADRTAEAFDRMAKASEAITAARNRTEGEGDRAEVADMRRQMAEDVAVVGDGDRERVSAAWRYEIAKKEAEIAERSAERQRQAEEESIRLAEARLALTEKNAAKLEESAAKAMMEHDRMRDAFGETDPAYVKRFEAAAKQAKARADAAHSSVEERRAELDAMRQNKTAADIGRRNMVEAARTAMIDAESGYRMAEARKEEARLAKQRQEDDARRIETERAARMRLEREVAAERKRLAAELAGSQEDEAAAQQRLAAAKSAVSQAWGWYRDKDSLKAQLDEEKADAEAQRQYEKDFEKLRFRRDWREAKDLTLDQEAVRRVAIAKEEEAAAQRAVAETAENTRRTAEALETIKAAVSEGGY